MLKGRLEEDARILAKYFENLRSDDPIIGQIKAAKKLHSGGIIYKSEEKKLEVPMKRMSLEASTNINDIYDFNLEKICITVYEVAQNWLAEMKKMMFSTLSQVTEFTGNIVDGKGKGLSCEMLLEAMEKTHIEFDQDGNPQLPQVVVSPELAKNFDKLKKQETLFKEKFEEIISKKKEAYYAEKGSRRLSRLD